MVKKLRYSEVSLLFQFFGRAESDGCKSLKNRPILFQQQLALVTPLVKPDKKQQIISREREQQTFQFTEVEMNPEEESKERMVEDEEKPFFKAAFDHFDWNHSSTIPTSVSKTHSDFLRQIENETK